MTRKAWKQKNDPVAFAEFSSINGWDKYQIDNFSVTAIAESFEIKNTRTLIEDDLSGHIVKLKINSEHLFAIADSGSPMSFLNKKTARRIQQHDKHALLKNIPTGETARNLACYNGEVIVPKEKSSQSNQGVGKFSQPRSSSLTTKKQTLSEETYFRRSVSN